ncbi:heterokaryon incompatibility protein-domain-containing protein [Hypoxylon sp. FL1284]|nr:heterokaryon incompatibility protein-domain-containing protein [Hypoxylon sp. FL1284]
MESTFPYEPLPAKSIRVIKLLPALHTDDPLQCSIRTVSLSHERVEPYEALSYVWGERARLRLMYCDGARFLLAKNCYEALVNLRRKFVPRVLWIDAVCINQATDDEATKERNTQVKMMGEVYLRARRVLIWLGPGNAATSTLFRYLPIFGVLDRISDDHPRLENILYSLVAQHFDVNYGVLARHKRSQLVDSMTAILKNPWFERVWTMQEVAFGRKCVIIQGQSSVDWESFCRAYIAEPNLRGSGRTAGDLILHRWRLYLSLRGSSLQKIPRARFEGAKQVDFELGLLAEIRNMQATVPHDKIYSLYAVFQTMGVSLPDPDYEKDVTTVFVEATEAYIRSRQSVDIIAIIPPTVDRPGLPSWVPDWLSRNRSNPSLIWKIADTRTKRLHAAPLLTENTGDGKLGVMGKTVGKIAKTICCPLIGDPYFTTETGYAEALSSCVAWRSLIDGIDAYPSGKDSRDIERTLLRPYHTNVARGPLGEWYRWAMHCSGTAPPVDDAVLDEVLAKRKAGGGFLVFVLDTGYVGTAHRSCGVGDLVALLSSLNPLVLRPREGNRPREFRIVTPAYCEGAMSGDLSLEPEELEEFVLV